MNTKTKEKKELNSIFWAGLAVLSVIVLSSCKVEEPIPKNPFIDDESHEYEIPRIYTRLGDMRLWLSFQTPLHRENYLGLVDDKFYDNLIFHRVIDDFVIQGGDPLGTGVGGPGYEVGAEIKTNLRHIFGAVAAARLGDGINPRRRSSGSQFYIVENREGTHFLDGEYTVFGQIITGYNTLESIGAEETNTSDRPLIDVVMDSIRIEYYTKAELLDLFEFDITSF